MENITIPELAKHLGTGESTLNKWITEMKKHGYCFRFSDSGKYIFDETDVLYFDRVAELKRQHLNMKTCDAVELALTENRGIAAAIEEGFHVETLILPQENTLEKDYTLFNLMQGRYNYLDEKLDNIEKRQTEQIIRDDRRDQQLLEVYKGTIKNSKEMLTFKKQIKRLITIAAILTIAAFFAERLF